MIGVIYLARAADGSMGLERFISSYVACPAGIEHHLWIALKGFASEQAINDYLRPAASVAFNSIRVPDCGFDIGTYWHVASHLKERYRYFCFLNTHSELVAKNWLRYMHEWASKAEVGAVSATGSYESLYRYNNDARSRNKSLIRRVLGPIVRPAKLWWLKDRFPPFPNPHLRTNAITIRWEVMEKVWQRRVLNKEGAYRFESGENSLTNRIKKRGLRVLVIGRNGHAYDIDQWPYSNTFRCGHHENLLVKDNRTREFDNASLEEKLFWGRCAWGNSFGTADI